MALFRIPKSSFAAIQGLIELPETDFEQLVSSFNETPPMLSNADFVSATIARVPNVDPSLAEQIVKELLGMLVAAADSNLSPEKFAAEISDADLEVDSTDFALSREKRDLLGSRLSVAFGTKGLQITAKARGVLYDTDKTYRNARILTDLRPIFDESANEVSGAVVIHNLRIRYFENSETRDIYLSLEHSDLESLIGVLERALKKGALLESSFTSSSIPMLK